MTDRVTTLQVGGKALRFGALGATLRAIELMGIAAAEDADIMEQGRALAEAARESLRRGGHAKAEIDEAMALIDLEDKEVTSAVVAAVFWGPPRAAGEGGEAADGAGGDPAGRDAA